MPRMTAIEAAVHVLEKEGVSVCFGVPETAINPFFATRRCAPREVSATSWPAMSRVTSHMADGYSRARAGNIGVCIGTSGPAGTNMVTGLYAAPPTASPSCALRGKRPVPSCTRRIPGRRHRNPSPNRSPSGPLPVREPGLVPRVFQQAFHLMRSGRPGPVLIDLPIDVQTAEIEFDIDTYELLGCTSPRRAGARWRRRWRCSKPLNAR